MTAEEYLDKHKMMCQKMVKGEWIEEIEVLSSDALKAIEIARHKEREKAMSVFKNMMSRMIYDSYQESIFVEIFKQLLNE